MPQEQGGAYPSEESAGRSSVKRTTIIRMATSPKLRLVQAGDLDKDE